MNKNNNQLIIQIKNIDYISNIIQQYIQATENQYNILIDDSKQPQNQQNKPNNDIAETQNNIIKIELQNNMLLLNYNIGNHTVDLIDIPNNLQEKIALPVNINKIFNFIENIHNEYSQNIVKLNNFIIYLKQNILIDDSTNKIVKLTNREISIIKYLYNKDNYQASKKELIEYTTDYSNNIETNTIQNTIYRLRQKLVENSITDELITTNKSNYMLSYDNKQNYTN